MRIMGKLRRLRNAMAGDTESRYVVAERVAARIHPEAIVSERDRAWLADETFRQRYEALDGVHPRRLDRAWNLQQFARYTRDIPGDSAECGVLEGVGSYFMCLEHVGTGKTHHAFDSFEGLSSPGESDGKYWAQGDLSVPERVARETLAEFSNVEFHKGWIPDRFSDVSDEQFCLVHIDVDLYGPTRDSLEFFLPRMPRGGLLVLDDYGFRTCPGARLAADQACAERGLKILELSSGQGLILT